MVQPAVPDEPRGGAAGEPLWLSADEVGTFTQGSPVSRWALARYLVGRAIGESVGTTLLLVAAALLGLAAAGQWLVNSTFLAVLFVIVALVVLLLRAVLRTVLRRLTAADRSGPVEARLRQLVSDTRGDVLAELRRLGLPSHTVTLPLLALRMIGKRRRATLATLRGFELDRAVPGARLDELHIVLRSGPGRG